MQDRREGEVWDSAIGHARGSTENQDAQRRPPASAGPVIDPAGTTWPSQTPVFSAEICPVRIGRYRVQSEIGAGGMGRVYAARDEQLDREVAVKVVRSGMASASAVERFLDESRLLAQIEHPGIARVYDCGIDESLGLPYFVMERVPRAQMLTTYAGTARLTISERLGMFLRVCEAVHAAHVRGIIHRDLKPSNILVPADAPATDAQPKVIDFGIAEEIRLHNDRTSGGLTGTLEYMSPEQCRGEPVDARSDVYSLGVVLYQLLSERLPFDMPSNGPTAEATRIIREETPMPLGAVDPRLKGDLEAVVQRSLRKDPERRYQSAAAMAADIRRHMDGQPIEARSDSVAYLARRRTAAFLRRHPWMGWAAVIAASYALSNTLGMALVYEYTPLDKTYSALLTLAPAASRLGPVPQKTVIVTLPDAAELADAAARAGIELHPDDGADGRGIPTPDSPGPVSSMEGLNAFDLYAGTVRRLLMARLLDRLVDARPSVVALDLFFLDPPPADSWAAALDHERSQSTRELAGAAERLRVEGHRAVVGGLPTWADPAEIAAEMSPGIEASMYWGGLTLALPPRQIALDLFVNRGLRPPIPSLTLEAFARRDGNVAARPVYVPHSRGVEVLYPSAIGGPTGLTRATRDTDFISIARSDEPVYSEEAEMRGLLPGDTVGMYVGELPRDEFFTGASMTISDALELPAAELATRFRDKAIIVARVDGDVHETDDGRMVPGCWAHAAGLESLLTGKGLIAPNRVESEAMIVLGCLLGAWAGGARRVRGVVLRGAGLVVLAGAGSLAAYHFTGYQVNPMVPLAGVLCGGVFRHGLLRV